MANPFITTYRGVVHPWLCDAMGHMNTRHYVGMFDDAMQHFMSLLGHNTAEGQRANIGWADVRHVIDYKDELAVGSLVHVDCAVLKLGNSSITYRQVMINTDSGAVAATNDAVSVLFDLAERKATPLPASFKDKAAEHILT